VATKEGIGEDAFRIYELVTQRFLATLCQDAQWKTMKILFDAGGEEYTVTGGQLEVPGWHQVYPFSEAKETILPSFAPGEKLPIRKVTLDEKETQPPARYTQSKLIQMMEELGLGTKSTRHEVIAKLLSRKYVEGNPLRPTLVGRVVTESLEQHADTITKPDMTRTIEEHMQQIKERKRTREDVIRESRGMLHSAFDQLEAHGQEIGDDIKGRTAEEMNLGKCPACGGTLAIKHMRGNVQFIGCSRYPGCTFNIGLPATPWGWAVRTDDICCKHGLNHVRLVRKGARPWDIGCPLCHHVSSNSEALKEIPSVNDELMAKIHGSHIYTVAELARAAPDALALRLDISVAIAQKIVTDAGGVLERLRRRSECRKFLRDNLIPRKGRSYSKIMVSLKEQGITEIPDIAKATRESLKKAGVGESEAETILREARIVQGVQLFREIGIPAVSLKKYMAAGFESPDSLCKADPAAISKATGLSAATVAHHIGLVSGLSGRSSAQASKKVSAQAPEKQAPSKARIAKGKKELLRLKGMTATMAGQLEKAGMTSEKIQALQALAKRRKETEIIRI
jgi:DNA topoisomerase-1